MIKRCECVAMILAGGQGSRLGALTKKIAKPAVPFGGKYKIIDFPLSNCANSGITTVGVLTQYQPLELNTYIGSGQPWDMDRTNGGAFVLPPYVKGKRGEWYKGTANAIYQNQQFIEQFSPRHVLVLSGDHIYKMDYRKMLRAHVEKDADVTIAVFNVPLNEASRYGIMSADEEGRIYDFVEKPPHPESTLASMGVYIFKWETLKEYLERDEADPNSSNDFGKDVIPAMLRDQQKMYAYAFEGYWKDVGTVKSLWEANMDMLGTDPVLNLYDDSWRIYSRSAGQPPQYIAPEGNVHNSCITEGCKIYGTVEHSVLFTGVTIERGAVVRDSIIFPYTTVRAGAVVDHAVVGMNSEIGENAHIGSEKTNLERALSNMCAGRIVLVGDDCRVASGAYVSYGMMIDSDVVSEEIRKVSERYA